MKFMHKKWTICFDREDEDGANIPHVCIYWEEQGGMFMLMMIVES